MDKMFLQRDIERYRNYLQEEEKSLATVDKYVRDVQKLQRFLTTAGILNKKLLLQYKKELTETYLPSSVNSMLASVNSFLIFLGYKDLCLKSVKRQKPVFCAEGRELQKKEYIRLLDTAKARKQERLYLIMLTLCSTGIRIGELKDITVSGVDAGRVQVTGKNKNRTVLIPAGLKGYLLRYIKKSGVKQGPVFVTASGRNVDRSNVWREMKKLCGEAGVSPGKVFPHNLRHLFARTYYEKQQDIVRLADILGHSQIETTRIYTISSGKEHERQINALGLVV